MTPEFLLNAWPAIRFAEMDSTNEEARRRAVTGDVGPCWLVTDVQTAGRGRLGRQWSSPKGNLFATALLPYPRQASEATVVPFAAGLAVVDAARMAGVDVSTLGLKWPNDVLAGQAKLSGILIETGLLHGKLWMAAGFGINVEVAPERPDRPTACLADLPGGGGLNAPRVLSLLDLAFRARLNQLLTDGFAGVRADWLACAAYLNALIEVNGLKGVMTGLADDGALMLRGDDEAITHVRAGEISLLN